MTRFGWGVLLFSISIFMFVLALKRWESPEIVEIGLSPKVFLRSPFFETLSKLEESLDSQITLKRFMESFEVEYSKPWLFKIKGDIRELERVFLMETGTRLEISDGRFRIGRFVMEVEDEEVR